jgi:hypothetical protein
MLMNATAALPARRYRCSCEHAFLARIPPSTRLETQS